MTSARQRREIREGDRTIIREPGRTIIREGNVTVIRRDESNRFRYGARNMIAERRGNEIRTIAVRPDGSRIINVTDDSGRLVRRIRRDRFGREYVIVENQRPGMGAGTAIGIGVAAGLAAGLGVAYLANVPPPVVSIPPEQYIVDIARRAAGHALRHAGRAAGRCRSSGRIRSTKSATRRRCASACAASTSTPSRSTPARSSCGRTSTASSRRSPTRSGR